MEEYLLWDDWDEDEDEEDLVGRGRVRREYKMRVRTNMETHDDEDFFQRYRMRKDTVTYILDLLRPALEFDEQR